jgi:hypothetical protein
MTTKQDEQQERKRLIGSSTDATSYRDLANLDNSLSGRFAIVPGAEPSVSGRKLSVEYPRQEGGPWNWPDGVEQPLGWSVEDQEPCGTHAEVEQSLRNAASSGFLPLLEDATAPTPKLPNGSDSEGVGDLSQVASPRPNPGDASTGATGPLSGAILSSGDVDPAPAFSSGSISREDLAELLGRLVV